MTMDLSVADTCDDVFRIDQDLLDKIDALDLECIKVKLVFPEEGDGWSRKLVDEVEVLYKRFLYMAATAGEAVFPTRQIDKFWHAHILDTQKYAEDCQKIFGRFFHHFPYSGMRGPDDKAKLNRGFRQTCNRYQALFGGDYGADGPANCEEGSCSSSCSGPVGCQSEIGVEPPTRPSFVMMEALSST